ncbi:hypothetical protein ACIG56_26780 [Nocardia fusca]|uniref:hypothetical protein n=1 Tax=Nocardia fusca TaxID=941183 RepID=UPI0037C6119F
MSDTYTGGFDMLVQISEAALNKQIASGFLTGEVFQPAQRFDFDRSGVKGSVFVNFRTPVAEVGEEPPQLQVRIEFSHSQLEITEPAVLARTLPNIGGTVQLTADLSVSQAGPTYSVGLDFKSGSPEVEVRFDDSTRDQFPSDGIAGQAQTLMEEAVLAELRRRSRGRLDFFDIEVGTEQNPIADIEVTTVNHEPDDRSFPSRDCVCLAMRMQKSVGGNETGGRIGRITKSLLRGTHSEGGVVAVIANDWLFRSMRQRAMTELKAPESSFAEDGFSFRGSVPAPGGRGKLRRLNAEIEDGRIRVSGRVTDSGTGWQLTSDFATYLSFELVDGTVQVQATKPIVHTDVDYDAWLWLLMTVGGGIFFGLGGAVAGSVALMFAEEVSGREVDAEAAAAFAGFDSGVGGISLGPLAAFLTVEEIELDDVVVRGRPRITLPNLTRNTGTHTGSAGFTLDLDSGTIATTTRPATDLIWDPEEGISTHGAAGLSIFPGSFNDLDLYTISTLPLNDHAISLAEIPISILDFSTLGAAYFNPLTFGVQTTDGRYAAVQVVAFQGQPLQLAWRTYDHPIPELGIAAAWSVLDEGPPIQTNIPGCNDFEVRWGATFKARPKLMAGPIDYQWCLCGTVLDTERGTLKTVHGNIEYLLDDDRLSIATENLGQAIECELCVSAVDARDQELFTCIKLSRGLDRRCEPIPSPRSISPTLVLKPFPGPEPMPWRPLKTAVLRLRQ